MKKPKKTPKKRVAYTPLRDPWNLSLMSVFTHGGQWKPTPAHMPSELKIYGQVYKVFYHTKIYSDPVKTSRLRGIVLYANRVIVIDPEQTFHELRETIYHEAGHVYLKTWQTKSEPLSNITHQQTEDFCDLVADAVCDLSRNNPPVD